MRVAFSKIDWKTRSSSPGVLLALERRRIAHPKGLGLRRFSRRYYSRDFPPAKWVSGSGLHGGLGKNFLTDDIGRAQMVPEMQSSA